MANMSDIFEANNFVQDLAAKHMDEVDSEALAMGEFGYLREVFSNIIQNTAITASEYSLEAIPTKAKFPKNVLTHAYAVGLSEINAIPAHMKVVLYLPEDRLENNFKDDKFTIDKNYPIRVSESNFEYHLDYDIVISKTKLANEDFVYTAQYDMSVKNPLSDISSPYLPSVGRFSITGTKIVAIQTQIRQVEITTQELDILTSNPLANKTFSFEFDNQLATFSLDVKEGDDTKSLTAVYDGLVDKVASYYCNYLFLETDTIRVIFKKESYQPRTNCKVAINLMTTHGSSANFNYSKNIQCDLTSDRFDYNGIWMILKPMSDSVDGEDSKSVTDLRKLIPSEQLARGTITNTTDLNNFFNSINTSERRLYFIKKLDSLERTYYSYVALKQDGCLIPANTINLDLFRREFDNIDNDNYILYPGNCIFYRKNSNGTLIPQVNDATIAEYEGKGFVYMNPFLMVVNKNPFYVSYLINILKCSRDLSFDYINQNSALQFISPDIQWKREYFTDRNTYKLNINLMQNINSDQFKILIKETQDNGTEKVVGAKIKVIAVLKNANGAAYRYGLGTFKTYQEDTQTFGYEIDFNTDNAMDADTNIKITDAYNIGDDFIAAGYLPETTNIDIYVLAQLDTEYGRADTIDNYVPHLDGYTLTNKYSVVNGVPLYYNYSKIISTYVNVAKGYGDTLRYTINKVPVIKYKYINTEERIQNFVEQFELIRSYLEYKMSVIEDGFGLDIKLFNTCGPANFFRVSDTAYINSTSLSLKWKLKLRSSASSACISDIKSYIKEYVENLTNLTDFHAPNLQALVTDKFSDQLVYFEFVDMNGYGPGWQHIYRDDFETDITQVPDLLSVNIKGNINEPDIDISSI